LRGKRFPAGNARDLKRTDVGGLRSLVVSAKWEIFLGEGCKELGSKSQMAKNDENDILGVFRKIKKDCRNDKVNGKGPRVKVKKTGTKGRQLKGKNTSKPESRKNQNGG